MFDGIDAYLRAIQEMQTRVIQGQRELLARVAIVMTETIVRGGRIFVFGTGHSHLLAEEAYGRAGGLADVVPILASNVMLHEGMSLSGRLERTAGLAEPLLERYAPTPGDLLFIFSNSGVNQLPVEMAETARARGMLLVGVCALEYARQAPLAPLGKRLYELVDYVIDNGGIAGDAVVPLQGRDWRVAPSSTVLGALIWNCLIAEVAFDMNARGLTPPVYVSGNLPGAAEHNAGLMARMRPNNPHL